MSIFNRLRQAYEDATNSYRAGMGLPPLKMPESFSPRVEVVCPYCGAKHDGPFQACSSCKTQLDQGA